MSVNTYDYTTGAVSGTPTTESYGYDGTVKDRLASFNNASVTYDANGRPVSYNGKTFAWTNGRLAGVSSGTFPTNSNSNTYTYDGYGRRTGKTLNTIILGGAMPTNTTIASTYYYDLSGRLIRESIMSSYTMGSIITSERVYLYDESGVIGMICKDESSSATYYFDKNIRGDVIGIYDANGTRIVKYGYDSWGNCTILSATDYTVANANPFRYRSYYYDTETGFYYLNSRYYSPVWRRFISPDSTSYLDPETPNGLNLYAYCNNDPVNYSDPSGNFAISIGFLIASMAIGAAIGAGVSGGIAYYQGERGEDLIWDIVGGAVLGLATGATIALGGAAGLGAVTSSTVAGVNISFGTALGISMGSMALANATKYSLDCISSDNQWSLGGYMLSGLEGAIQGAATFGIAYIGGKSGLFNDKIGNFSTPDVFFRPENGGINTLRSVVWASKVAIGETLSKAILVSGVAALVRLIIGFLIPNT